MLHHSECTHRQIFCPSCHGLEHCRIRCGDGCCHHPADSDEHSQSHAWKSVDDPHGQKKTISIHVHFLSCSHSDYLLVTSLLLIVVWEYFALNVSSFYQSHVFLDLQSRKYHITKLPASRFQILKIATRFYSKA